MVGWVHIIYVCICIILGMWAHARTPLSIIIHACVHNNNNNNLYFLYIALFFIRNELTAFGRVVSFEACCQWALLSVSITRLVTLITYCTEVH